jgi:hypothetical protein
MASISDLIAGKQYDKALAQIRSELKRKPKDQRLRLQHADVLVHTGKNREAVTVLLQLADDHAADGFTAKAIAILKRVEKMEPNRADVKGRLKSLVQEKVRAAPTPSSGPTLEIGMEEFDPSQEISIGASPVSVPDLASHPDLTLPPPPLPAPVSDDMEGLDYVEVEPDPEPEPEQSFLSTPLFEGLSQDELMAVIQGLSFSSYAAGDILVAEGAPGDSLFILTTGRVKAWVRDPSGHYKLVKELEEGSFFGEISVLTGRPRTATITAASDCEVLDLDRATLDSITERYPRVREVLKKFHEQRAMDTVETLLKRD